MSETGNLKLKKHDNPETSEEKFDVDNYLNGNWDKIDENAEKTNNQILQLETEKTKLEKELKEAQEDFYQNSIRGQASGEYIHVEDSSNCRAKIGIGGNSEQETSTQGKNYFTGNKIPGGNNFGVNYSFDNSILKLNGTATNSGNIIFDKPTKVKLPAGTCTYTIKVKSGTFERPSGDFAVYIMSASNTFITGNYSNSGITGIELTQKKGTVSHIFNLTEEKEIYLRCYTSNANIVFNNLELEIQIESDSVYTEFEQFVPNMPSLGYQSPIKTVGSNVNLFDKNTTTDGKYISSDGSIQIQSNIMYSDYIAIEANKKYYISGRSDLSKVALYDKNKTFLEMTSTTQPNGVLNITNSNCKYIIINALLTNKDTLKIEKGNVETSYSSYNQGSVKVTKCNKNLFGKYITGIWMDVSKKLYLAISTTVGFIARVKPNTTYTIKKKNKGNRFILTAGKEPVKIGNAFSRLIFASNNDLTQYTFTTKENEYYIFLGVYNGTDENELVLAVEETQLEQNPTATNYEEHQEQSYIMPTQQPLRAIGDYKDTFIKKDGKWFERHYIARRIFNGIVNKFNSKHSSIYTDTRGLYQLNLPGKILGTNGSVAYGKSNYLKYKNGVAKDAIYQDCLWWENTSNYNYASIPFLSLTEANEWLVKLNDNGNPFYIDYVLAEPLDIECTEEQSKILDELENARTYKNVTNITTDSIAILDLDYAKDLETLLNNTQALAVNNASEGV